MNAAHLTDAPPYEQAASTPGGGKRPPRPHRGARVDVDVHYGRKRPPAFGTEATMDVDAHYGRKRPPALAAGAGA